MDFPNGNDTIINFIPNFNDAVDIIFFWKCDGVFEVWKIWIFGALKRKRIDLKKI